MICSLWKSFKTGERKATLPMPGADKAVKSREDGVTRFFVGYTVFFLCGELLWKQ